MVAPAYRAKVSVTTSISAVTSRYGIPARIAASITGTAVAANGPAQLMTAAAAAKASVQVGGATARDRRHAAALEFGDDERPVWPVAPRTATRLFMVISLADAGRARTSVRNDECRTVSDMHSVALAVTDGTPLFELAAACEVFGVDRGLADSWYDFTICGPDGAQVGGWLTGGPAARPGGAGRRGHGDRAVLPGRSRAATARAGGRRPGRGPCNGARVASLCTGAFVLAEAGLLDGRRATTHWAHADALHDRYPAVRVDADVLYIDEGDVLTSAGKAAGMDLCLHLVRTDHGTAVANALARTLVVPPHRPGGQAQYIPAAVAHGRSNVLAGLMAWALDRLDQPLTVRDLAREAGMSPRNLARHFHAVAGMGPLRWLLTQRVAAGPGTAGAVRPERGAGRARTGMGTATTLRRHFSQQLGVPPESYRRTFRAS